MKETQKKLSVDLTGKILIDSTNRFNHSNRKLSSNEFQLRKRKIICDENSPVSKISKKDSIFCDSETQMKKKSYTNAATQTDSLEEDAKEKEAKKMEDFLTAEKAPSEYWERLAESRRKQLEKVMKENEALKEENEYLKGDNKALEEMVEEAKLLAKLVNEVTNEPEDE